MGGEILAVGAVRLTSTMKPALSIMTVASGAASTISRCNFRTRGCSKSLTGIEFNEISMLR
jgi:hypothetical protein